MSLWLNWACWGSLSVDSGRELYVAGMLAQGKTLYRDMWYLYHPAAPYFNSLLFRLFGTRVEVMEPNTIDGKPAPNSSAPAPHPSEPRP